MDIAAGKNSLLQICHLFFKSCRKDRTAHHLDQSDVLLLDMVLLRMRVKDAQRILLCRDIVPKHQIQLIAAVSSARDRCDGAVLLPLCLRKNECRLICVGSPGLQDSVRQVDDSGRLLPVQPDHRHRPLHDAGPDILISSEGQLTLNPCLCHREFIMSALEMFMRQNRSADNREIRIRSDKVMRELPDKVKQLFKRAAVNLHRHMLRVEHNTVFIIVDIRRVLKAPVPARDPDRNHAVIFPCRMIRSAGISDILIAELTLRIGRLGRIARRGDCPRVLLRLGQVDRDVEIPVLRGRQPPHILCDPVPSDIIGVLTERIIPVRRLTRAFLIQGVKLPIHLRRSRRQISHQLCVKQIAVRHRVVRDHPLLCRIIAEQIKDRRKPLSRFLDCHILFKNPGFRFLCEVVQSKLPDQRVRCPDPVLGLKKPCHITIFHQFRNRILNHPMPPLQLSALSITGRLLHSPRLSDLPVNCRFPLILSSEIRQNNQS